MGLIKFVGEITKTMQQQISEIEQEYPEDSPEREEKADFIERSLAGYLYRATKHIVNAEEQQKLAEIEKVVDDVFIKLDSVSAIDMITEIIRRKNNQIKGDVSLEAIESCVEEEKGKNERSKT